jgi:hypothetical protein
MLAPAGCLLEAFEGALSRRVPKRERDMSSPRDAELRPEDVGMGLGSSRRYAQALRDLSVGASLCDQLNHLSLAESELLLLGHGRKRCWQRATRLPIDRPAYLVRLHPSVYKGRGMAAGVHHDRLPLVESTRPYEKLELIAEMRPHHLGPVCGDRELDTAIDEHPYRVAQRVLVRNRARQ